MALILKLNRLRHLTPRLSASRKLRGTGTKESKRYYEWKALVFSHLALMRARRPTKFPSPEFNGVAPDENQTEAIPYAK